MCVTLAVLAALPRLWSFKSSDPGHHGQFWNYDLPLASVWGLSWPSRLWQPLTPAVPCGACNVSVSAVRGAFKLVSSLSGKGPYLSFHGGTRVLTLATAIVSSVVIGHLTDALGTHIRGS